MTELDELIKKRQQWIKSSKENNFDFDNILAGIYNDPSHFIYEILQNAEDANATEISFNLYDDRLEIIHNGKNFDYRDVDGITGIGISTKKDDINSIGKFGVGFKAVFAITKTPIIHSGIFHFRIEDFVVPSLIDKYEISNTLIVLQFNHPSRTKEEVVEIVSKKLEKIGLKILLFLKNIKEIKWQTPVKNGHYYKEFSDIQNENNASKISIISQIEQKEDFEEFIVIKKPLIIDSHNLNVEIAYRIKTVETERIIEKEKDSKLIVFFPTEKVTYLNFLIQGPYKTTPNRENIPLDDEQNRLIIEETANLVAESISIIKKLGLLNISFLEVLPIDPDHTDEIIYSSIFKKVKNKLLSEEAFLPALGGNFSTAQDSLLARGKELTEILRSDDINILFNKKYWLDTKITSDRSRILHNYLLNELDIREVDFENFARNISLEFIEKMTDDWLLDFYSRLLDQRSLWYKLPYSSQIPILREKPIIRLSNNTHIAPYDKNNKIQVYLPAEIKSNYKTIKEVLMQNDNALKFLKELGLSEPDIYAEIKEFIVPKYDNHSPNISLEEYFEDFKKILIAFENDNSEKKKEFIDAIKNLIIIYSTNSITGDHQFCKPDDVYLKIEELVEYFKDYDHVFFVSDEFEKRFANKMGVLNLLFIDIGCANNPRKIKIEPTLTWDDKSNFRKRNRYNGLTYDIYTFDFDYEGLDNFLKNLTKEKSLVLWNYLLSSLSNCQRWAKYDFFKGEYCWFYHRKNIEKFDAKFLKTLKNTNWLVDNNNKFVLPSKISFTELSDSYIKNDESVEVLMNVFGFQNDEIKKIEERTGGKFIPKHEYDEYLKWKNERTECEKESNNDSWKSEIEPENVKPTVEKIEPERIETPDLRGQCPNEKNTKENEKDIEINKQDKPRDEKSKSQLRNIGNWGEKFVYNFLQEKFGKKINMQLFWLNENGDIGKGYDFSVVSEGSEMEYIEVKSKVDVSPQLIEITGTQWEFARKLFEENEGYKYKIYVVSNVGTQNAKIGIIENPIKLWKEGKLFAHPVRFKL